MPAAFAGIGIALGASAGIGAVVVGIAASAAIGAAIGGLAMAITGGDIGKGMLFGAVGGVVTGGLAGGMIAPAGYAEAIGTQAAPIFGGLGTEAAAGAAAYGEYSVGAAATQAVGGSSSLFGGALGSVFQGTGGALVQGAGALFKKEPETPYSQSQEYLDKQLSAQTEVGLDHPGFAPNYTRETTAMQTESAERQLASKIKADARNIKLQTKGRLSEIDKTYSLENVNATKEWDRAMGKLKDASGAAGGQKYQSGGDYEAIVAAQKARGNEQPSRGVLMGPIEGAA